MTKLLISLVLSIPTLTFAQGAPEFWQPRSRESLVIAGTQHPFRSYRHFELEKAKCLKNVLRSETRFFMIGEAHPAPLPKEIVGSWLRALKDDYGYTHVALEAFNAGSQVSLDAYMAGGLSEQELKVILEEQWFYDSEGYMNIVREAKALGLDLIAVDDRNQPSDFSFSQSLIARDKLWAKILGATFDSQPDAKIILLAGTTHSFETFAADSSGVQTVIEQLEDMGIPGQSLFVSGGLWGSLYELLYKKAGHDQALLYRGCEIQPYTSGVVLKK